MNTWHPQTSQPIMWLPTQDSQAHNIPCNTTENMTQNPLHKTAVHITPTKHIWAHDAPSQHRWAYQHYTDDLMTPETSQLSTWSKHNSDYTFCVPLSDQWPVTVCQLAAERTLNVESEREDRVTTPLLYHILTLVGLGCQNYVKAWGGRSALPL